MTNTETLKVSTPTDVAASYDRLAEMLASTPNRGD